MKYKELFYKELAKQTKWRRVAWVLLQQLKKKERDRYLKNTGDIENEFFELQKNKKAWWIK